MMNERIHNIKKNKELSTPEQLKSSLEKINLSFSEYKCIDIISPNLVEVLKYLKSKNYELGILTNWFKYTQEERLKRAGILKYFDYFVYGEDGLKPTKEAYLKAIKGYKEDECIIIGDDIINDVLEPLKYGIDTIWFNKKNKENTYNVKEIKDLIELKKYL